MNGDRDMHLEGFAPQKIAWFRELVLKKNFLQVVDLHFQLSEAVRYHYKKRQDNKHLLIAISACEYMVCISDISLDAMIAKEFYRVYEYEKILGSRYPHKRVFISPSNLGYRQLGVILRRKKMNLRDEQLKAKMIAEGWCGGEIDLSTVSGRHFIDKKG